MSKSKIFVKKFFKQNRNLTMRENQSTAAYMNGAEKHVNQGHQKKSSINNTTNKSPEMGLFAWHKCQPNPSTMKMIAENKEN